MELVAVILFVVAGIEACIILAFVLCGESETARVNQAVNTEREKQEKLRREEQEKYSKICLEKDKQIKELQSKLSFFGSTPNNTTNSIDQLTALKSQIRQLQSENDSLKKSSSRQRQFNDLSVRESKLKTKESEYEQKKRQLDAREQEIKKKEQSLREREQKLSNSNGAIDKDRADLRREKDKIAIVRAETNQSLRQLESVENQISSSLIPLFGQKVITNLIDSASTPSFLRGLEGDFSLIDPISFNEVRVKSGDHTYMVSLTNCTCPSMPKPCKHMIWLAMNLGALHFNPNDQKAILNRISDSTTAYQAIIDQCQKEQDKLKKDKNKIKDEKKIIESQKVSHPELSKLLSEYEERIDEYRRRTLISNAPKSAEKVDLLKKEKKRLMEERTIYFNKVTVYESLFPWLLKFQSMTMDDIRLLGAETSKHEDYVTFLRVWLTPEEYVTLSSEEKLRTALSRCRKK